MKNLVIILFALATTFTAFANVPNVDFDPTPETTITADNGGSNIDLIVKYIQKEKVVRVHGGYNVFLKVVVKNEGYYTLKEHFYVGFKFATSATQTPNEPLNAKVRFEFLGAKRADFRHVCLFIPDSRLYGTNILGIQAKVDVKHGSWRGRIHESNEYNNKSNTAICYLNGPS